MGAGEASFSTIAPQVVNQLAPDGKKGVYMGLFSAALPLGLAAGYIGGALLNDWIGWRNTFISLAIITLLVTLSLHFFKSSNLES